MLIHHKLTWDDTGKGTVHSHWSKGGGGTAKGRHDWRRPAKGCEASSMTVVAVVVSIHSRWMTHHCRLGPIVAQERAGRSGIWVVWSVLQSRALVLFTPDTTHRQACKEEEDLTIKYQDTSSPRKMLWVRGFCHPCGVNAMLLTIKYETQMI